MVLETSAGNGLLPFNSNWDGSDNVESEHFRVLNEELRNDTRFGELNALSWVSLKGFEGVTEGAKCLERDWV